MRNSGRVTSNPELMCNGVQTGAERDDSRSDGVLGNGRKTEVVIGFIEQH